MTYFVTSITMLDPQTAIYVRYGK